MTLFARIYLCVLCMFGLQAQAVAPNIIEKIEFRGLNRVPVEAVRATVHTKAGDVYNEEALRKDFKALWDTGRFNDIQVKKETGERGGLIVRFVVTEREGK